MVAFRSIAERNRLPRIDARGNLLVLPLTTTSITNCCKVTGSLNRNMDVIDLKSYVEQQNWGYSYLETVLDTKTLKAQ